MVGNYLGTWQASIIKDHGGVVSGIGLPSSWVGALQTCWHNNAGVGHRRGVALNLPGFNNPITMKWYSFSWPR